ncbi:MAG: ATP-binding cassette domain-containing protein, partial [Clostridium botulinum]|nr:ATP-binding cassette domain-containing protein [Clostridium botulinum]MDU5021013.1 ATP-binding cassette domain-containing protein [Clostridiales bacterium]
MIKVTNLSKQYSNKNVVDNVSINIEKGKITSFIGPNGAGKSTVLSMITRILKKDSGEVLIDGKRLEEWDNKELSKKLAILKQSNNINLKLTIRELVSFGRYPHSEGRLTSEDNRCIDEAIRYMKLDDIENK